MLCQECKKYPTCKELCEPAKKVVDQDTSWVEEHRGPKAISADKKMDGNAEEVAVHKSKERAYILSLPALYELINATIDGAKIQLTKMERR